MSEGGVASESVSLSEMGVASGCVSQREVGMALRSVTPREKKGDYDARQSQEKRCGPRYLLDSVKEAAGVDFLPVSLRKGGVASVPLSRSERGIAPVSVRPNEGGVAGNTSCSYLFSFFF